MIRGTTPTYTLIVEGYDLTDKTVYVTILQLTRIITLTGERLAISYTPAEGEEPAGSVVVFGLTQRETLSLRDGDADVQIKFIGEDGNVEGTDTGKITIKPALLEREIEYKGGD